MSRKRGDVNNDGKVGTLDATHILSHIAGLPKYQLSGEDLRAANIKSETNPSTNGVKHLLNNLVGNAGYDIESLFKFDFKRDGEETFKFDGQTTRIQMAKEIHNAFGNTNLSKDDIYKLYTNHTNAGFSGTYDSKKQIWNKLGYKGVHASDIQDDFHAYLDDFEASKSSWIVASDGTFKAATAGQAGLLEIHHDDDEDGDEDDHNDHETEYRKVNAKGFEIDQMATKSTIGALSVHNALNYYLDTRLDFKEGVKDFRAENDNGIFASDEDGPKKYTNMEHKWDEAFGYCLNPTKGSDGKMTDILLHKYIMDLNKHDVFEQAFYRGREAIVKKDYVTRNKQAAIIRRLVEQVLIEKAKDYVEHAKEDLLESDDGELTDHAAHDLSEAYGFIYSLQFTKKFTRDYVMNHMLPILTKDQGLWSVTNADLEKLLNMINTNYDFSRNGSTTVSYSGQKTRIQMAKEIHDAFGNTDRSKDDIYNMYINNGATRYSLFVNGSDYAPSSGDEDDRKQIWNKLGTSLTEQSEIQSNFQGYLDDFEASRSAWSAKTTASAGQAGLLEIHHEGEDDDHDDKTEYRKVNAKGFEIDQMATKSTIGALSAHNAMSYYLDTEVPSADNDEIVNGKNYTEMEHKWDEAYGYCLYWHNILLAKYARQLNSKFMFETKLHEAFMVGRQAIVDKNYSVRDAQAAIIKELIADILIEKAKHYVEHARKDLNESVGRALTDHAAHDLSEGYGFIYSLQFIKDVPGKSYTRDQVNEMLDLLKNESGNGLWDITDAALASILEKINSGSGDSGSVVEIKVSAGAFGNHPYTFTDVNGNAVTKLDVRKTYKFVRLNNATSHPFYVSDAGYRLQSTGNITLTGDGSAISGITGTQSFTLKFNDTFDKQSDTLTYFCTVQSHNMRATFTLE